MIKQKQAQQSGQNVAKAAIKPPAKGLVSLEQAILALKTPEEVTNFLSDLLTPAERAAFDERWLIAQKLVSKAETYRDIAASTGASTTTVTRVARFLFDERHHGYKTILDRLNT